MGALRGCGRSGSCAGGATYCSAGLPVSCPGLFAAAARTVLLLAVAFGDRRVGRLALNGSCSSAGRRCCGGSTFRSALNHGAAVRRATVAVTGLRGRRSPRPAEALRRSCAEVEIAPTRFRPWWPSCAVAPCIDWRSPASLAAPLVAGSRRGQLRALLPVHRPAGPRVAPWTSRRASGMAPGGFTMYPTGFHTVVASLSELTRPDLQGGPDACWPTRTGSGCSSCSLSWWCRPLSSRFPGVVRDPRWPLRLSA